MGGLVEARRIHQRCRDAGVSLRCGGMLETGLGRALNLAVAALPGCNLPPDLGPSARYFRTDLTPPFTSRGGTMIVPDGPGLGVEPLPEVLDDVTITQRTFRRHVTGDRERPAGRLRRRRRGGRAHRRLRRAHAQRPLAHPVAGPRLHRGGEVREPPVRRLVQGAGALNKLLQLGEGERAKGVVAMSAGNHAQAVAYHATRLGIDATIVMPTATPFVKVQRTRELGATVVLRGDGLAEAEAEAERLAAVEGRTYVHPFDDADVIAGQGTCPLELLADHPDLDALVVPGGWRRPARRHGGRRATCARHRAGRACRPSATRRWPTGCTTTSSPAGPTIAEGIAVPRAGALTGRIVDALVDDVVTVSEEHIEEAVNLLLEIEKVVTEGPAPPASPP